MSKIVIRIGNEGEDRSGNQYNHTRPVMFVGKEIASVYDPNSGKSEVIESLYRLQNGQLAVHYTTKITTSSLVLVSPADLDTGGRFETLGSNAGMVKVLTLTEALDANLDHG